MPDDDIIWRYRSASMSPVAIACLFAGEFWGRLRRAERLEGTYDVKGKYYGLFEVSGGAALYELRGTADGEWTVRRAT